MENEDTGELIGGGPKAKSPTITLQKAIDMGEYDPEYLATFPEWYELSRHFQWQIIREALKNRTRQLRIQWAEVVNQPDFSKKPNLKIALKNIEKQLAIVQTDEENLQVEYSA